MASNPPFILAILAFLISSLLLPPADGRSHLLIGESLSVERASSDILVSPNGVFAFGFYNLSSTVFVVSVWFAASADRTVAWTANRHRPVHAAGSKLTLPRRRRKHGGGGGLVLTDYDGTVVWEANYSINSGVDAAAAELTDEGNLVVRGEDGGVMWQSFDWPTDTLLPTQPVTATARLTTNDVMHPTSYYSLRFDDRYILSLAYDGPEISNIYWPDPDVSSWLNGRISYNVSRRGALDDAGFFLASDNTTFAASDADAVTVRRRRLTLDHDGNLRLYTLRDAAAGGDGGWSVTWTAFSQPCGIHGLCGWNGLCAYTPRSPSCSCPPGYFPADAADRGRGCVPAFNFTCAGNGDGGGEMGFARLPETDFWGSDLTLVSSASVDACKAACLALCNCVAFEYKDDAGDCYLKSALFNGKTYPGYPGTVYLKLPANFAADSYTAPANSAAAVLACDAAPGKQILLSFPAGASPEDGGAWRYYYGFLAAFFAVEVCFVGFGWWFTARSRPETSERWAAEEGYRVVTDHFRRFTYGELKKATKNFKDVIGHGRYGSVYKGVLAVAVAGDGDGSHGRVVAVKKLKATTTTTAMTSPHQGHDEFETEVSVIGRINHMNLVRIRGVCSERRNRRRLLVYEYVENGSLATWLFGAKETIDWSQRYHVAVGVAKGLAYLHHECIDCVIHCDVKPENILLDEDFEPKISDFGLMKLQERRDQDYLGSLRVRGTRGYMAPEWVSNIPVTKKVDVYSYGVVLLELVRGVRMVDLVATSVEGAEVAMRQLVWKIKERLKSDDRSWIIGFVDPRLNGRFMYSEVVLMLEVATSCLEKERNQRPSMNDVIKKFYTPDKKIDFIRDVSS
uniref:Receptor-like serine/threonine-protein kinase n=1 Tax=Leersia perrieri TaxID=77586 RepID=A0A0D9V8Q3_9ORYZ